MRVIKFDIVVEYPNSKRINHKKYTLGELCLGIDNLFETRDCKILAKRQYIGCDDKNGIEIYEGDIVNCNINSQHKENIVGYIEYVLVNWFVHGNDGKMYYFGGASNIEIIGNIYENPELLEISK